MTNKSTTNIYTELPKARIALQAQSLKKAQKGHGFNYMGLEDFLPQVNQIMADFGICGFIQFTNELAVLTLVHAETGSQLQITSPMAAAQLPKGQPVQNLGATQTYLRRYLWLTAMEIVEHDAIDGAVGGGAANDNEFDPMEAVANLEKAKSLEVLKQMFAAIWPHAKGTQYQEGIKSAYDKRKTVLEAA